MPKLGKSIGGKKEYEELFCLIDNHARDDVLLGEFLQR